MLRIKPSMSQGSSWRRRISSSATKPPIRRMPCANTRGRWRPGRPGRGRLMSTSTPGWFMVVTTRNCWFCRSSEVANCVNASISLSLYIYIHMNIYIYNIYFTHLYLYLYHWKVYTTLDLFKPVLPKPHLITTLCGPLCSPFIFHRQELNDKRAAEEERKQLEMEARQKLEKQLAKEELLGPWGSQMSLGESRGAVILF